MSVIVQGHGDVGVAHMLFEAGIKYEYEKELPLGEGGVRIPDFTIDDTDSGTLIYLEHCGMTSDPLYRKRWEEKKLVYAKHDTIEGENLIISCDNMDGSIDSVAIKSMIEKYF